MSCPPHVWIVEKDSNFQHCDKCGLVEHLSTGEQFKKEIFEELDHFRKRIEALQEDTPERKRHKDLMRAELRLIETLLNRWYQP